MKKIIYSQFTKFIFVLLFIISITMAVVIGLNCVVKLDNEKVNVYKFEGDFEEARFFNNMLQEPEQKIFNIYVQLKNNGSPDIENFDENTKIIDFAQNEVDVELDDTKEKIEIDTELLKDCIERELRDLYYLDQINYCIELNGTILSNCSETNPLELTNGVFYMYLSKDENGKVERLSNSHNYYFSPLLDGEFYELVEPITIATSVKSNVVDEYRLLWEKQAEMVYQTINNVSIFLLIAIISFIYLTVVCGKDENGNNKKLFIDNVWVEIQLVLLAGIIVCGVGGIFVLLDEYYSGYFDLIFINKCITVISSILSGTILFFYLSIIRNIKVKGFLNRSIIYRIVVFLLKTLIKIIKWLGRKIKYIIKIFIRAIYLKTVIISIGVLFLYTVLIGIFGILMPELEIVSLLVGILLFFVLAFFVARRSKEINEIKKGIKEIRKGNLTHKISDMKSEDLKILATDINEIRKGLDESVAEKLKAERLKTELITNVSHDIKTPLTSIISYTELLSKVEALPEEAKDYTKIIANKSERLKVLTQDLFEISKVQSGNEIFNLEKLDISLLIEQSLAEHDNEIKESKIPFCVNLPKELYVMADGRKMSRVISNLINNVLKYTMKNTRVFISSFEKEDEIIVEFKNISAYPMDFDGNEITGRFVRGDKSRTSEGNGLGLAIVKEFVEACDGKFDIVIDGDMFKAMIIFKKVI